MKAIIPIVLFKKLLNELHQWIGKFVLRNKALQGFLIIIEIGQLKVLHIHNVQWLLMGQIMK